MKYLYLTFLFIISSQLLLAQNPAEKAYLAVINEGPSTGPSFVVMTIINSNTRESKEMILTINELFNCLTMELNESDSKKIKKLRDKIKLSELWRGAIKKLLITEQLLL